MLRRGEHHFVLRGELERPRQQIERIRGVAREDDLGRLRPDQRRHAMPRALVFLRRGFGERIQAAVNVRAERLVVARDGSDHGPRLRRGRGAI